jgi:hypothetical protein
MSVASKPMTIAEFLALPDDGVDRELIRGEVKNKGMTYRNRVHAKVVARITHQLLGNGPTTKRLALATSLAATAAVSCRMSRTQSWVSTLPFSRRRRSTSNPIPRP